MSRQQGYRFQCLLPAGGFLALLLICNKNRAATL